MLTKINCSGHLSHVLTVAAAREQVDVSAEVLENVDPVFYGEVRQAALKALGLN